MNDTTLEPAARALLAAWPGEAECGGLPPLDGLTPAQIEAALYAAIGLQRARVEAIAASDAAPSFDNVVAALEASATELKRVKALYHLFNLTSKTGEMPVISRQLSSVTVTFLMPISTNGAFFIS